MSDFLADIISGGLGITAGSILLLHATLDPFPFPPFEPVISGGIGTFLILFMEVRLDRIIRRHYATH